MVNLHMGWLPMDRLPSFLTWAVSPTPELPPAVIGIALWCVRSTAGAEWSDASPLVKTFLARLRHRL